ncbi:MAG: cobalt ECF transporter T component CbiQ [Firmicutes bacterium]|nr:cobalt ECF transporter T component CbiQ [Bacillota bacterium]
MSSEKDFLQGGTVYEERFITSMDSRIKIIFSLVFVFAALCSKNAAAPAVIAFFSAAGLFFLEKNLKKLALRSVPPLLIALTVMVSQFFFSGKTAAFSIGFAGLRINVYFEGIERGVLLASRVLAGAGTLLLLAASTPADRLIAGARRLHVPNAVLEVLTIAYRYVFILLDEVAIIRKAQKTRLGFSSLGRSLRSFGYLAGIVMLRVIDKSEKLYKSMKSRGYNGQDICVYSDIVFSKKDWVATAFLTVFAGVALLLAF